MTVRLCSFPGCDKPHRARGLCNAHREQWRSTGALKPLQKWDRTLSPEARFWAKVDRKGPNECWEWQASLIHGYGSARLGNGRSNTLAHRYSFELVHGAIREGFLIDHICRNRKCVNPAHLREVTRKQNAENMSGPTAKSTSGRLGVSWNKKRKAWEANVGHEGKLNFCGFYADREDAAEAARQKRVELFTHNELDQQASHLAHCQQTVGFLVPKTKETT